MSHKSQVKTNFAFRVVLKWWVGSSQTGSCMNSALRYIPEHPWALRYTPEHPWGSKTSLNTPEDTPICPLTFPKMKQMLTYAKEHQQTVPVPIKLSPAGTTPSFWHKLERQDYFAQLFWDIKISKPPNVTFLKMVELCHFLSFSDLSERNYNSQSFWITLYL